MSSYLRLVLSSRNTRLFFYSMVCQITCFSELAVVIIFFQSHFLCSSITIALHHNSWNLSRSVHWENKWVNLPCTAPPFLYLTNIQQYAILSLTLSLLCVFFKVETTSCVVTSDTVLVIYWHIYWKDCGIWRVQFLIRFSTFSSFCPCIQYFVIPIFQRMSFILLSVWNPFSLNF